MKGKIKRFFQKPTHVIAVLLSMAVVGVGSAFAFNALAGDPYFYNKQVAHFYWTPDEPVPDGSTVEVQFWRYRYSQASNYCSDPAATFNGTEFQISVDENDTEEDKANKQMAIEHGTITPNTDLQDPNKKVYLYSEGYYYFYDDETDETIYPYVYYCVGSTTVGNLKKLYGGLYSHVSSGEIYDAINNSGLNMSYDDSENFYVIGDDYYWIDSDNQNYYIAVGEKPDASPWKQEDGISLHKIDDYRLIDWYYIDDPDKTYSAEYAAYDYAIDPNNVAMEDGPYSTCTLVKSSTGKFWFSQDPVTIPIPKNNGSGYDVSRTEVRILVDGNEVVRNDAAFDSQYMDLNRSCFASLQSNTVEVFTVSDTLQPFYYDGYDTFCTPIAVRVKYEYKEMHKVFPEESNRRYEKAPQDANAQAVIEESEYSREYNGDDADGDDGYISTYYYDTGINPHLQEFNKFFDRYVSLAGSAKYDAENPNRAPEYSPDGSNFIPVKRWKLKNNPNKTWDIYDWNSYVDVTIGELFCALDDEYYNYGSTQVLESASGRLTYNNQSGFYEYTFVIEPDIPLVKYEAVYLDQNGNPQKTANGEDRTVDLSVYGDTYQTESYANEQTVTVEDKLADADFPGYTFSGWELEFPSGYSEDDLEAIAYEPKKDEEGNVMEGQYTDNVMSFTMSTFGLVLKGKLTPTVFTLTYDTNGTNLSAVPTVPQNDVPENAPTQTFTIENLNKVYKEDAEGHITDQLDYYKYTFPSRTTTADGYTFKGWGEEKDSTEITTFIKITDLTQQSYKVYAEWENTVTYQPGTAGSTAVTGDDVVNQVINNQKHDILVTCPFTAPTGYSFSGWELVSPTGKDYTAKFDAPISVGTKITVKDNLTYKATWTVNKHKVKYELTGENQPTVTLPDPTTGVEYSSVFTDIAAKPTATGYTFSGWTVKDGDVPTADITSDADGYVTSFKMPDKDVTLQGSFAKNKYQVSYEVNGTNPAGTVPDPVEVEYEATFSDIAAKLTATGYTFTG